MSQPVGEVWSEILHLITYVHHSVSAELITKCEHPTHTPEEESQLPRPLPNSVAFQHLRKEVIDKQVHKKLGIHTGQPENLRSLYTQVSHKEKDISQGRF